MPTFTTVGSRTSWHLFCGPALSSAPGLWRRTTCLGMAGRYIGQCRGLLGGRARVGNLGQALGDGLPQAVPVLQCQAHAQSSNRMDETRLANGPNARSMSASPTPENTVRKTARRVATRCPTVVLTSSNTVGITETIHHSPNHGAQTTPAAKGVLPGSLPIHRSAFSAQSGPNPKAR